MKIKRLLSQVPLKLYKGNKEVVITGVTAHSKLVHPGSLFICKKKGNEESSKHMDEAIANGALAIVCDMPNPFLKEIVQLIHSDVAAVEGKIAASYYEHPSQELFMVGVTGTSGKTSVTYLLKHLLDKAGSLTGMIGTIEYVIGDQRRKASLTTPEVVVNHKMLREMRHAGCQACVMEVSSHGLSQGRVDEIEFDAAVFTNLSHDHLDYHHTMEEYAAAKERLFSSLPSDKWAVVNCDDPYGMQMLKKCKASSLTYGFSEKAMVRCTSFTLSAQNTCFEVSYQKQTATFRWNLIGKHNIQNALAAIGVMLTKGMALQDLVPLFETVPTIPGRLERVGNSLVFVDYAHKPDALEKVLLFLNEVKKGKLLTVFGCGGERDHAKRPLMAKIAETYSDLTIVTSDNPRSENPLSIIEEIQKGFLTTNYLIEPDRRKAIEQAIGFAKKEDLILIAGKGHETYQLFSHKTLPFDDRQVAAEILAL